MEEQPQARWSLPARLPRRSLVVIAGVVLLFNLPLIHYFLLRQPMKATEAIPFRDDFSDPATVAQKYFSTGGLWRVDNGRLFSPGVKNNPLWLKAALPDDAVIEFDAVCVQPGGDIRFEAWGDGSDHASGYHFTYGGKASLSRLDERSPLIAQGTPLEKDTRVRIEGGEPMQPGRVYRMRVERSGTVLRWLIDGREVLRMDDPTPFKGKWHDRFGFGSWDNDTFFDNLSIGPAGTAMAAAPVVAPVVGEAFSDAFDRAKLGDDWLVTNPEATSIVDGALTVQLEHNRPTWLRKPLPQNALIEFDAWSESPSGDIKVELYGDGRSFYQGDLRLQYTATGYVLIFGGWNNTASVIARHNEHLPGEPLRREPRVEVNRKYHWSIRRQGAQIDWAIDGAPFLSFTDPQPLSGANNAYLAFSGWEARVHFDNLSVKPL